MSLPVQKMSKPCYIGIDTSNYTTSVAVADERGEIVANLKAPLPVKAGERGLRQSDAVFAHTKNLPALLERLRDTVRGYSPVAVCYSAQPRDAENSYMPCFLSGAVAAHAIGAALDIPVFTCSHQQGHLMAAMYSSGAATALADRPFGAFHVSGGTTDMLLVTPNGKELTVKTSAAAWIFMRDKPLTASACVWGSRSPAARSSRSWPPKTTRASRVLAFLSREGIATFRGLKI